MARLASGYAEARIIQTAVSLGLFDTLEDRGRPAPEIAASLRTDRRATELLLNALTALGLLEKRERIFSLSEVASRHLVRRSPKYFGGMILFDSSLWNCWGALEEAVRSGRPARSPDMFQRERPETERFIHAMHSLVQARGDAEILIEKIDFTRIEELLDVGSGPGTYPIYFCRNQPKLRAAIFDLPGTLEITKKVVSSSGVSEHIRLIAGDYRHDPIPGSYDMIFLCNIIHSESFEENSRLLAKLYPSLKPGGKVVIKDHILDDPLTHPAVGAVFSMLMLLTTEQGRCYSFREVKEWLDNAGFSRVEEVALPHPLTSSLVIGEKS